jgi:hypothetical protein
MLGGTGLLVASTVTGAVISGNTISGSKASGINSASVSAVIAGNTCFNNGMTQGSNSGIFTSADGQVITGNRCFDNQGGKTQAYGIRVFSGDNIHLAGNLLEGNLTSGLLVGTPTNLNSVPYRKIAATVGNTQTTIAHGLPYIPLSVAVTMTTAGTIWRSAASDATNIYLTADAAARTADVLVG